MKNILYVILVLSSIESFCQFSGSGSTQTTPATEVIINNTSQNSASLWFTPPNGGPGSPGNYYIKAFDYWGSSLHFQGTGDGGNERMNVTIDGKLGIGVTNPSFKLAIPDLDENVSLGNNIFLNGENSTGRISNNAYKDGGWKIYDNTAKASTIELRDNGVIEMYGTLTDGQTNWRQMFGFDAPNNKVYFPNGNVGVGTTDPKGILHVNSISIEESSVSQFDANLLVEGGGQRELGKGAVIGFAIPSADNGNSWQQGRIMVTPDNNSENNAHGRMYLQTRFWTGSVWDWKSNLVLKPSGNVGIGTEDPQSKLAVEGQIRATEVKVLADISVPDYVFEPDYELRTLRETKEYISEHKHLPEIPSAAEIGENGIDLGDMNMRLLKKIEELTLYQIELMEKLEAQQKRIEQLENK